jgi:hypothetical protein
MIPRTKQKKKSTTGQNHQGRCEPSTTAPSAVAHAGDDTSHNKRKMTLTDTNLQQFLSMDYPSINWNK